MEKQIKKINNKEILVTEIYKNERKVSKESIIDDKNRLLKEISEIDYMLTQFE